MKNITKTFAFVLFLGATMLSCSMVEGAMGEDADVSSLGGFLDTVWGLLKGFLPSLAAWEGFGSIFSQRKREHYSNMVMAVVPINKNVEFGEAVKALGSGLGLAHSSEASADAHADTKSQEKPVKV